MIFLIAALVVVLLVALALAALGVQLMQQSGRILERVETLEGIVTEQILSGGQGAPADALGLPLDSVAPMFELPDLGGRNRSLGEWRGRRTLLVFIDPASQHCLALLDSLRTLNSDVAISARPTPLIISIGDPAQTTRLFDALSVDFPVLVHHQSQVAASYIVDAVPASYIISEDGLIAGAIAYGNQAVLVAAGETGRAEVSTSAAQRLATDELAPQQGLKAGTQAPIFRLPKLGGGEVSLLEFRGRDTLLVFTDPECEPCLDMLPALVELSQRRPEVAVVMVSRGEEAANQEHFAEAAATIAIGLQRNWEISREYELIATPVGYLIDEWGLLASDVAMGGDYILGLVK